MTAHIPEASGRMPFPVYEFRPTAKHSLGTVLRYANGAWVPDDGEWDLAFVSYGMGAPLGLYVDVPYQRNILWKGLTTSWQGHVAEHPNGNPWHYMLREGETTWGGPWHKDNHPNERAGREAMNKCCSINRCANGRGPKFEIGDPYIALGLLRNADTKQLVEQPRHLSCMYCGDAWALALSESASA